MDRTRREALLCALFGAGWVGLRALATGLPIGMFLHPRRTDAAGACDPALTSPKYLIIAGDSAGSSLNANVPGTYADPGIYHPTQPTMAAATITLGGTTYQAALPWTQLDAAVLARTCFFHHATYTNAHGDQWKVGTLMGAVRRQEMMLSMFAKQLAPCLQTIQNKPVVIGSADRITYDGSPLPSLDPGFLRAVLSAPTGPLLNLQQIRDTNLDKLNALYKQSGTIAQRAMLDKYALSQTQARSLSQTLLNDLSTIKGGVGYTSIFDFQVNQNIAAAVLIKMNATPVVTMFSQFGGDNHNDPGLAAETAAHLATIPAIGDLMARLKAYQLDDKVVFAIQNVFGRTLATAAHSGNADGRNHNDKHHCTLIIGQPVKSCVVGGVVSMGAGKDYRCQGIDSATGAANDAGDIAYEATLGSLGKTLGRALGIPQSVLDYEITTGKPVLGALA